MFNENLMLNGRRMLLEVEQDILVSFIRSLTCTQILSIFKIIVNLYQTKKNYPTWVKIKFMQSGRDVSPKKR